MLTADAGHSMSGCGSTAGRAGADGISDRTRTEALSRMPRPNSAVPLQPTRGWNRVQGTHRHAPLLDRESSSDRHSRWEGTAWRACLRRFSWRKYRKESLPPNALAWSQRDGNGSGPHSFGRTMQTRAENKPTGARTRPCACQPANFPVDLVQVASAQPRPKPIFTLGRLFPARNRTGKQRRGCHGGLAPAGA